MVGCHGWGWLGVNKPRVPSPVTERPRRNCSSPWNFARPNRLSEYTLLTLTPICTVGHIHLQAALALFEEQGCGVLDDRPANIQVGSSHTPSSSFTCPALPQNRFSFYNAQPFCNTEIPGTCNKILLSWARGIASTSCKLIFNHPGVLPSVYCSPKQLAHTDFHLFPHHVKIKSVSIFLPPSCLFDPPNASFLSRQQHA